MYLAHLEKLNRTRLCDVLVEEGVLDRARVEEAQAEQETTGKQLGEILIESEVLSDHDLAKIVVTHYALPYLDVANYSMRREVVELLPLEFRHKWAIQPLDQFGSILTLAVSEIPAPEQIEEIIDATHLTPILFIAPRRAVLNVIEEEKKRLSGRAAAKQVAKHAAQQAAPASPAAPQPKTGPVAGAAPSRATAAAEPDDASLPEFDLPTVPMKLAGAAPAARVPNAAVRATPAKDPHAGAKAAPGSAAKPGPVGALSWMDAVSGGKPAAADPSAARVQKPVRPAGAPATGPVTGGVANARPAAAPAKGSAPAKPASPAAGAWQSIFDAADESVKKPKQ